MEFGIYSFGDVRYDGVDENRVEQTLADTIERIRLADDTGLDYFGLGEHHRPDYSISAPATVLAAASTVTSRIKLGSAVTVLSTEDPVRVFQQFATIDLLSHGRAELVAGRGSFTESFPIFGASLDDYDALYAEKLDLLLTLNDEEVVTWSGRFRPALDHQQILPRPSQRGDHPGKLDIWVATGGNPESSARAGALGVPVSYAIIGGHPERFAPLFDLYRRSALQHGHDPATLRTAIAAPGFVGTDSRTAKDTFYPYWIESMARISSERGFPTPTRETYDDMVDTRGAIFVGSPDEVAAKIVHVHCHLGMDRVGLQMDWSGVPQELVLESIRLFATEVAPRVRKALADGR
ncbi:LLM class flavin-dependent oxidoreductase [Conyzicola sp.]|uniref:LLM class flavin-dependent oxidoreductase n=1 Tax=Conyzicola sp. TaxID=1969404 RepID=UPI003988D2AD